MGCMAWYYNAGQGVYYWTEGYTLSATQFANKVSQMLGKSVTAGDVSAAMRQSDIDSMNRRASTLIYVS
ncbi:MAG: hypothetical protein IKL46_02040 [Clostridia bacterium]|nr:hypothetical protein [Clostridia bacterium]